VAALVLVGGGCSKTAEPSVFEGADAGPETLIFSLSAQNNSGESGTATITPISDTQSRVSFTVTGAPAGVAQPVHIHTGSCPTPGGVKYPLTNVANGASETVLDVTVAALKAQAPLALNVHKSTTEVGVFVSCGNLPK